MLTSAANMFPGSVEQAMDGLEEEGGGEEEGCWREGRGKRALKRHLVPHG